MPTILKTTLTFTKKEKLEDLSYLHICEFFYLCERLFPKCKSYDAYISHFIKFSKRYAKSTLSKNDVR